MKLYLIGSLRNLRIPTIAAQLRDAGYNVWDDWFAAGPNADDCWRDYEQKRGHTFVQALKGYAADHVFQFDRKHLCNSDVVVLVCPAGKSGHLELGWALGRGTPGYILLDQADPDRFDVMYKFADGVFDDLEGLIACLQQQRR